MNHYSAPDQNGQPRTLVGPTVVTYTQRIDNAQEAAWSMKTIGSYADVEIQHRFEDLDRYDEVTLDRWAITRTVVADPPVRREVAKLTVAQRLNDLGVGKQAMDALNADPLKLNRWFFEGLTVFADDPDLLAMLQGIGLTADQIAQVTA